MQTIKAVLCECIFVMSRSASLFDVSLCICSCWVPEYLYQDFRGVPACTFHSRLYVELEEVRSSPTMELFLVLACICSAICVDDAWFGSKRDPVVCVPTQ